MNELVLVPDHFFNCPICGQACEMINYPNGFFYMYQTYLQKACQVFICLNLLANCPLHYYAHIVDSSVPERIAFQEFSLRLSNKDILFGNLLNSQKSIIKSYEDKGPFFFDFCIEPDFPNLTLLAKKVKTYITFS